MQNDPTHPQREVQLRFGRTTLTIQTPENLDDLLDTCIAEAPYEVDRIPYYAMLWPAAQGLARHIHEKRARLNGRTAVELGCGLGLPSVLAAYYGASVTATDFQRHTEPWLTRNATRNKVQVAFRTFDWNQAFSAELPRGLAPADFVLGSDLLYERRHIPALAWAIERLTLPGGEAWIADPGRDGLPIFVSAMETNGWRCDLAPQDDIYVLRCTRRAGHRRAEESAV